MALYQVEDPQGQMHNIEGPEGASPEEVIAQAQNLIPKAAPKGNYLTNKVLPDIGSNLVGLGEQVKQGAYDIPMAALKFPTQLATGRQTDVGKFMTDFANKSPENLKAAAEPLTHPIDYGYEHPVSQALNVAGLASGITAGAAKVGLGKEAAQFVESISGVDKRNIMKLATKPMEVMQAEPSSVTGKAFQAAKEAAGVTGAEDRALALSDGARKRVYKQVLEKIDNMNLKKGQQISVSGNGTNLPDQTLTHNGPTVLDTPEKLKQMGFSDEAIDEVKAPTYHLSADIPDHPAGSTLTHATLKKLGYEMPESPSVADLLKAKKAGQLIAKSDPAAAGLIQKEIAEKVNPLLEKMAPDVYEAQQANHLSHVKESFMHLFPQTSKGKVGLWKTAEAAIVAKMLGPAAAALFSPLGAGAATLGGSMAARAAVSPLGKAAMTGFGLHALSPDSYSNLQSMRDKMNNP